MKKSWLLALCLVGSFSVFAAAPGPDDVKQAIRHSTLEGLKESGEENNPMALAILDAMMSAITIKSVENCKEPEKDTFDCDVTVTVDGESETDNVRMIKDKSKWLLVVEDDE